MNDGTHPPNIIVPLVATLLVETGVTECDSIGYMRGKVGDGR